MKIVITCEHGGNDLPKEYQSLFKNAKKKLQSHEGWDIGSLELAILFGSFADYFYFEKVSRLLIELNRSVHHPRLFSNYTKNLNPQIKQQLLEKYYFPYRNQVTKTVEKIIKQGECVLHLSVHSFTPCLGEEIRKTDIGLLYDPRRTYEKNFCRLWKEKIYELSRDFQVRYNYPYQGKSDGFVTFLRKQFDCSFYLGFELEVNQEITQDSEKFKKLKDILLTSFRNALLGPVVN